MQDARTRSATGGGAGVLGNGRGKMNRSRMVLATARLARAFRAPLLNGTGDHRRSRLGQFLLALLLLGVTCALWSATALADSAALSTDKADYRPEQVVHISGTGFTPGQTYAMPVK